MSEHESALIVAYFHDIVYAHPDLSDLPEEDLKFIGPVDEGFFDVSFFLSINDEDPGCNLIEQLSTGGNAVYPLSESKKKKDGVWDFSLNRTAADLRLTITTQSKNSWLISHDEYTDPTSGCIKKYNAVHNEGKFSFESDGRILVM